MIFLNQNLHFPPLHLANKEGLLAVGGDLSVSRLLLAYQNGIFPWYQDGEPILWWSPNPRMVLFLDQFKISKSLKKVLQKNLFTVTLNQDFEKVLKLCASVIRKGQTGTWITKDMQNAYLEMYQRGFIISVEVWQNKNLVGGLYGVNLKNQKIYCGESMFSLVDNASKVGMAFLVHYLQTLNYKLIDCQMYTTHLESLGAKLIDRNLFISYLKGSKMLNRHSS